MSETKEKIIRLLEYSRKRMTPTETQENLVFYEGYRSGYLQALEDVLTTV